MQGFAFADDAGVYAKSLLFAIPMLTRVIAEDGIGLGAGGGDNAFLVVLYDRESPRVTQVVYADVALWEATVAAYYDDICLGGVLSDPVGGGSNRAAIVDLMNQAGGGAVSYHTTEYPGILPCDLAEGQPVPPLENQPAGVSMGEAKTAAVVTKTNATGGIVTYHLDAGGRVQVVTEHARRGAAAGGAPVRSLPKEAFLTPVDSSELACDEPCAWMQVYNYNKLGQVLQHTMPNGNILLNSYDPYGNLTRSKLYPQHRIESILGLYPTPSGEYGHVDYWRITPVGTYLVQSATDYEPFFSRAIRQYDPRDISVRDPNWPAPAFVNPSIVTAHIVDYQEGALTPKLTAIKTSFFPEPTFPLPPMGLGDVNGDGLSQDLGNIVKTNYPSTTLPTDTGDPGTQQNTSMESSYNDAGQLVYEVNGEGISTSYEYFPYNDPDGDGTTIDLPDLDPGLPPWPGAAAGGGYRKKSIDDSGIVITGKAPTRPASGVGPRSTQYEYDAAGNAAATIDHLGREYRSYFNALNQVWKGVSPPPFSYEKIYRYDGVNKLVMEEIIHGESDFAGNPVVTPSLIKNASGALVAVSGFLAGYEYNYVGVVQKKKQGYRASTGEIVWEREHKYFYNIDQKLIREVDFEGHVSDYLYDPRDLLWFKYVGNDQPPGSAIEPAFFGAGYESIPENADVSIYAYGYDGNRNLLCDSDAHNHEIDSGPPGDTTFFDYDQYDRLITKLPPSGTEISSTYDIARNPVRTRTLGDYLPTPLPTPPSDPVLSQGLLSQADTLYDELGRAVVTLQPIFSLGTEPTGTTPTAKSITVHDRVGKPTKTIDPNGNATHSEYDTLGREKRSASAKALDLGDPYLSAWSLVTRYFDAVDRLEEVVTSERRINGSSLVVDKVLKVTTTYDNLDRPIQVVDAVGQAARSRFDSRGNAIAVTDGRGPLTGATIPRKSGGTVAINDHGNLTESRIDTLGRTVEATRHMTASGEGSGSSTPPTAPRVFSGPVEGVGTVTEEVHGPTVTTHATFNRLDKVLTQTDDTGKVTTYEYDLQSRLKKITHADGTFETNTFDKDSLVTVHVDGNGTVITKTYDAGHRLVDNLVDGNGGALDTHQAYRSDGLDRVIRSLDYNVNAGTGDDHYAYRGFDSLGRLVAERLDANLISSGYDSAGNKTSCSYPGGTQLGIQFDSVHRVQSIGEDGLTSASYLYAGSSPRIYRRFVGTGAATATTFPTYDGANRLIALRHAVGSTSLLQYGFFYNRASHRTYETKLHKNPDEGNRYEYDSGSRLLRETRDGIWTASTQTLTGGNLTEHWMDGAGNWEFTRLNGDPAHQNAVNLRNAYTTFEEEAVTHDASGDRVALGDRDYFYDGLHRLVTVMEGGAKVASYEYFADSRRARKNLTIGGVSSYVYDGKRIIETRNGAGAVTKHFVYGLGALRVLSYTNRAVTPAQRFYLLEDALGSTVGLVNAAGALIERYEYSAYGEPRFLSGAGAPLGVPSSPAGNPFLFAGYYYDDEVAHYWLRARVYDPHQGRFLSVDPIGVWGDASNLGNGYGYAKSNPINSIDPTGLYETDVHYDMTYYLGLHAGLEANVAQDIAWNAQYVDVHPETTPMKPMNIEEREKYHFRREKDAEAVTRNSAVAREPAEQAIADSDPDLLGVGMHAFQDSYSHEGFENNHATAGHAPDEPHNDLDKALEMAEGTYKLLNEYKSKLEQKTGQKGDEPKEWKDIKGTVETLLAQKSNDEKERSKAWQEQIKKEFPGKEKKYEDQGKKDPRAKEFLDAAKKVKNPQDEVQSQPETK